MTSRKFYKEAKVSLHLIRPLLDAIAAADKDVEWLLNKIGLTQENTKDPNARIRFRDMVEIWRLSCDITGDPALGIHVAESLEPGTFDVIEFVTRYSVTFGEAIKRICRYYPLIHDAARPVLERSGNRWSWDYRLFGELPLPRVIAEYALGAWLTISRKHVRGVLDPVEVHFVHKHKENIGEYERFFRAPIRLGADKNALIFANQALELPHKEANEALCKILDNHIQRLLDRLPKGKSFYQRVRESIAAELTAGDPSAAGIARKLRVSPRTLRRRMSEEGITFRQVTESLRRDLALMYLKEESLSINEVGALLGFADTSAFHKAFKRWTRQTPADYRLDRKKGVSERSLSA